MNFVKKYRFNLNYFYHSSSFMILMAFYTDMFTCPIGKLIHLTELSKLIKSPVTSMFPVILQLNIVRIVGISGVAMGFVMELIIVK